MSDLFDYQGDDCHVIYKNIFKDTDDETGWHVKFIRQVVAEMWEKFKYLADPHFKEEFPRNPDTRYWEMYLGCCLLDRGFEINNTGKGPDFSFRLNNKKIWIEAVTASPGQDGTPDRVPELVSISDGGGAQAVPRDKIILRYRTSLAEKEKKFQTYLKERIVDEGDIKIIAVSGGSLKRWPDSDTHPYILSAVFPLGSQFLTLDRKTGEVVGQGRHFQAAIKKANGAEVETLFFSDPAHSDISAVIYSYSDIGNPPKERGIDIVVIHNPLAKNPLPLGVLKFPTEYWAKDIGDSWELKSFPEST